MVPLPQMLFAALWCTGADGLQDDHHNNPGLMEICNIRLDEALLSSGLKPSTGSQDGDPTSRVRVNTTYLRYIHGRSVSELSDAGAGWKIFKIHAWRVSGVPFGMNQERARLCMYICEHCWLDHSAYVTCLAQQQNVASVNSRPVEPPTQAYQDDSWIAAAIQSSRVGCVGGSTGREFTEATFAVGKGHVT